MYFPADENLTPSLSAIDLWGNYVYLLKSGYHFFFILVFQSEIKLTSKRNIESVSRQYVNAKRSSQEYDNISRGLIRGGTSVPLRGTPQESQQLQIWKRIINWEKSNPTRTEDQAVLVKRGK